MTAIATAEVLPRSQLSVSVAATSTLMVPLATVKSELGITGSGQDTWLSLLIRAFGEAAAGPQGMRREPWRQTYLEKLPGEGGDTLELSRWPVWSVTSVTYGEVSPVTVTASEYAIVQPERASLYRRVGWGYSALPEAAAGRFASGPSPDYAVTYVAGWYMPGEAGSDDETELPALLQIAARLQVVQWFRGDLDLPIGIERESSPEGSESYSKHAAALRALPLSPTVRNILESFR